MKNSTSCQGFRAVGGKAGGATLRGHEEGHGGEDCSASAWSEVSLLAGMTCYAGGKDVPPAGHWVKDMKYLVVLLLTTALLSNIFLNLIFKNETVVPSLLDDVAREQ